MATKYIFVTGGVVSGLGKGITAASLGRLLKCRGLKVASQKLDPYVNVDPGTMSPLQHGEVFVTDDGTETDLDLGHYERFIDEDLNKYSNLTTGKVYWNVLNKERQGAYLGQTVQIIPHITNEIKSYIYNLASSTGADVVITEIGGTTGDIESQPFLEAIRQVGLEQGPENCCYIHVVLVPYISGSDEYKSKPAQHSVKELQGMGIVPNVIVLRADGSVGSEIRRKISTFCNVPADCVIENLTMPSLYQCPLMLHAGGLDNVVCRKLALDAPEPDLDDWKAMISRIATRTKTCTIALVGKYVKLHDAYLSVMESLYHAGFENESQVEIKWVDSENLLSQEHCAEAFAGVDGIIVPGGFGDRGIEGMIQAAQYARENNIPYFGICLGMQIMVMEFARNVLGYADANSGEFTPCGTHNVIALMADQQGNIPKGGTMRLGKYPCKIVAGTKMAACYGTDSIWERHRHRYEFNNDYRAAMQEKGLVISGTSPDERLVETVELPGRPFHVGVQFHPEFKSRPNRAHPLFKAFIAASLQKRDSEQ
ncbi:MAG: CTP synthase [Faecalibacterium sp.]|jgi:CTP synthase|nr:CTP synthase [Faecalibacterium sp.]